MRSIVFQTSLLRRAFRAALLTTVVVITWLALADVQHVPAPWYSDKVNHLAAFFVLAFLAANSFPHRHSLWLLLGLLGYGLFIEVAQWFTPDRSFELADLLADGMGVLMYLPIRRWTGNLPRRLARAA